MWTSLNKKVFIFISIILLIGIISGILFLIFLNEASKELIFLNINEYIQNLNNYKINNIFMDTIILSSLLILSIFIIGIPLSIFFIFFNGFSIGFIISSLSSIFGFKGLIYSIIHIIINKFVFLFFLYFLFLAMYKIVLLLIKYWVHKEKINKDEIIHLFKKIILCLLIIIIYDLILYFFGNKIMNLFNFLII
ncbi:MAG: hypothetical protein ACLUFU_00575 [Bacilli bacterium]